MNSFFLRLIPMLLHMIRSRSTEPSTLAGVAVLSQIAKVYFPELGTALDIVGATTAGGAVVLSEKGKANETIPTG